MKRWNWHRGRLEAGRLGTDGVRLHSARRLLLSPGAVQEVQYLYSKYSTGQYVSYCSLDCRCLVLPGIVVT